MTGEVIVAIITVIVTAAGIASAWIQAIKQRKQKYIIDALSRFSGGRQQRNTGISVIGHYWREVPKLQGLFVRLLTVQGVYIIAEGKPEKAHEYCNLERIVRILELVPNSNPAYDNEFNDLIAELKKKGKAVERNRKKAAELKKQEMHADQPDADQHKCSTGAEFGDEIEEKRITIEKLHEWIYRLTNRCTRRRGLHWFSR